MSSLRVAIVDDEPPARRRLRRLLDELGDIAITGEAGSVSEAVALLRDHPADLVLLDIKMPDGSGFDVVQELEEPASLQVAFVTAYNEFAVQAFAVAALDYLVKPVSPERLQATIDRARQATAQAPPRQEPVRYPQRFLAQKGASAAFVAAADIHWTEADRNYMVLHTAAGEYLIRSTLEAFHRRLDPAHFARVNRSAVVNVAFIDRLLPDGSEYEVVLKNGHRLAWTRKYLDGSLDALLR